MESWLTMVARQLLLFSLPALVSLSLIGMIECRIMRQAVRTPLHTISWRGTWWPLLASLAFQRGIVIALPRPVGHGMQAAAIRCASHLLLSLLGLLLFAWSTASQPPAGPPPLYYWWAKILMFFNLCMACLHLLPLPGLIAGQYPAGRGAGAFISRYLNEKDWLLLITLLAASPLPDMVLGGLLVFPLYESMNNLAATAAGSR